MIRASESTPTIPVSPKMPRALPGREPVSDTNLSHRIHATVHTSFLNHPKLLNRAMRLFPLHHLRRITHCLESLGHIVVSERTPEHRTSGVKLKASVFVAADTSMTRATCTRPSRNQTYCKGCFSQLLESEKNPRRTHSYHFTNTVVS